MEPGVLDPEAERAWRPLMGAFGRQLGLALNPERARAWAAGGWRADDVEAIAAMSAAAVEGGSFYGRQYRAETAGLRHRLGEVAVSWYIHCRLTRPEVLGWLRVVAGAPSADEARAVEALIGSSRRGRVHGDPRALDDADVTRWRALPVDVGPLAWAAGLSVEEADERRRSGSADTGELHLLAALRGFRIDPGTP
ncbi:hypothetical protein GB931_14415 [Modestobacter sp. I12A-02628]|uniref:Uncharacterized protein n=1 Tax=Goekera deserti TaxID=2497753 RepID=A0A7K3WHJ5_9ACTN|nr:hypothetical protein [Goekera deserti]MPQ99093.1 hypothetical protein [Goekera deserti]NDI47427.1 hypothetical protein [Goekera deserti]NEL55958.1 hypothetical protein [Goekera deserti]